MTRPSPFPALLRLEARDPQRNIARRYSIAVSTDLLGATLVDLSWGRIGAGGQHRRHAFDEPARAEAFVARVLRQRAGATRRIGVAYRRVDAEGPVTAASR